MTPRRSALVLLLAAIVGVLLWRTVSNPAKLDENLVRDVYNRPVAAPQGPLHVFHLGHSLVGRDMPAMLAQLAPAGHRYESQLGWGTSLKEHWQGVRAINGFDAENAHERYRDVKEAIGSGEYDAMVMTEMVEIKDAVRYHDSMEYLHRWSEYVRTNTDETRLYLYETWHHLNDPAGWLDRLDVDLREYWENQLALAEMAQASDLARPVYIIPAGQVMAAFVRRIEREGGVGNVTSRESLFARNADGSLDTIHINDLGAYLVALTHYSVLYHRSPVGLPHMLRRADGTAADSPTADAARAMQETVWEIVSRYEKSGVQQ